jgi:hypothetical protein
MECLLDLACQGPHVPGADHPDTTSQTAIHSAAELSMVINVRILPPPKGAWIWIPESPPFPLTLGSTTS